MTTTRESRECFTDRQFNRRLIRWGLIVMVLWLAAFVLLPQTYAEGAQRHSYFKGRLVVSGHGVVKKSTLPSCTYEDGGGPAVCTWNIQNRDGNGHGLAFWRGPKGQAHYVWATDPTINGWHWLDGHADCPVKGQRFKCANGSTGRVS